jgi:hypothetical protein
MDFIVIDASTDDIDPQIAALERAGPMPFQVDTIGSVLAIDRALHGKNYIAARSVAEMVSKILMKLGGQNIGRLTIWGHGAPGIQRVGAGNSRSRRGDPSLGLLICLVNGRIRESSPLGRLCGRFSWDGRVDLHGCNVAQHHCGRQLLRVLCDLWQVPVRAAVNAQHSHANDRFDGPVIEAYPRQGHTSSVHVMNPRR